MPKNLDKGKLTNLAKNLGGLGSFGIRSSALARRIILFNLIALSVLLTGMLYLNQFKGGWAQEKQAAMQVDASLYTRILQSSMVQTGATELLDGLPVSEGVTVRAFRPDNSIAGHALGVWDANAAEDRGISGWLGGAMSWVSRFDDATNETAPASEGAMAQEMAQAALSGQSLMRQALITSGETILSVARPVVVGGNTVGAIVLTTQTGYLDSLLRGEQETVLRLFLLAVIVSVVLSIVLANAIANPINDLAAAAEAGTTKQGRNSEPERVRIPDLTGRPDEIGHLSRAMRGMTEALYERIDTNEEFAADVAHEIKNPLASLRSAVETLRIIKKEDSRVKLLDVIEHDVRRLDRLVSDISNASRLDAELVKEELEPFDLTLMLDRIVDFHSHEAGDKGVELIWSQPDKPIMYDGLEARLAQVFVNLITNAVSFCGEGDAVRVWAREKDNRVLIVVEDTGPGIPNEALTKVFKRFYSERSEENFGNNSGLGLSISKQIVEAHKGVIWAENIHAKGASEDDAPLGARFVVGLPV
ncbi:MAG: sensor histidine kinase [Rhodobacteraceae bacterium]|nr:sensor histidine kinase [Paracoccaceae bacterium]